MEGLWRLHSQGVEIPLATPGASSSNNDPQGDKQRGSSSNDQLGEKRRVNCGSAETSGESSVIRRFVIRLRKRVEFWLIKLRMGGMY